MAERITTKSLKGHTQAWIRGAFVVLFVAVGVVLIVGSHAQTPTASIEPEDSTSIIKPAVVKSEAATSNNSVIQFGTAISTAAPPIPTVVPTGFTRDFTEDFNTDAPLGTFPAGIPAYANRWSPGYDGLHDTSGLGTYSSKKVLSVSDGSLFYNLHSENGIPYVAVPIPDNYKAILYGQVGMSVRASEIVGKGYKIAFLLWPTSNMWSNEVDFPEVNDFNGPIKAVSLKYSPNGDGANGFSGVGDTGFTFTDNKYHQFLLDWRPGAMTASIDGQVVYSFTGAAVPNQAMRLTLQAETWIGSGAVPAASHVTVEVPWVYVNKYN